MKLHVVISALFAVVVLAGCKTSKPEAMGNLHHELDMTSFYLPNAAASRVVSVTTNGVAAANILVPTQRVAVKEGGPKETVEKFGEVYAFSPNFFAVQRDEPTPAVHIAMFAFFLKVGSVLFGSGYVLLAFLKAKPSP